MTQIIEENRGRPRSFDENEVLNASIPLFLQAGYFGISISEILQATKLERSSFYLAFGDKVSFYCKVLRLYHARAFAIMKQDLYSEGHFVEGFNKVIDFYYDNCTQEDFNYGCLTANAATEVDEKHELISRTVGELRQSMVDLYAGRLEQAKRDGQTSGDFDAVSSAQFLKCCLDGMAIHARGQKNLSSVDQICDHIRDIVKSWKNA